MRNLAPLGSIVLFALSAKKYRNRENNMIQTLLYCVFCGVFTDLENSTFAEGFVVEHPTLLNLGFEWSIRGDVNRNASVAVQFRAVGDLQWREALPLVRIGGENVYRRRENLDYTVPDGFAGSILNVEPGTEYECRFQLTDPDGASGETTRTVNVRTRAEPQPFEAGRKLRGKLQRRLAREVIDTGNERGAKNVSGGRDGPILVSLRFNHGYP
jgi:hypothetical protein